MRTFSLSRLVPRRFRRDKTNTPTVVFKLPQTRSWLAIADLRAKRELSPWIPGQQRHAVENRPHTTSRTVWQLRANAGLDAWEGAVA